MRCGLFLAIGLISGVPLSPHAAAQSSSFNGPVEAYTFDLPTRSIRPVIGIPGAASFGPAVMQNIELASVAPGRNYGVVFEGGKCLLVAGLGANKVSSSAISGVTAYPDGVAWSASGSLAILYSHAQNWFQTISGFPDSPVAGAFVDLSSLPGALTAVAADASGQHVAVALSGDKGAVYEAADNWVSSLASMTNPISLSFSSDGNTLYALDAATVQVEAIALANHSLQTLSLDGISNPVAIRALQDSQNRSVLYIAGGQDRLLRILDVAGGQTLTDLTLNFQPTGLDQFGSNSFVLAGRSQSAKPLWLFSSTPAPAAFFVPAVHSRQPLPRSAAVAGRTR